MNFTGLAYHFGDLHHSIVILRGRLGTLDVSGCEFLANHIARAVCTFQGKKIDGSLARNIGFVTNFEVHEITRKEKPILRMSPTKCSFSGSNMFSCGVAMSMEKAANLSFSNISKEVLMSFCMAGVALRDILTCQKNVESLFV